MEWSSSKPNRATWQIQDHFRLPSFKKTTSYPLKRVTIEEAPGIQNKTLSQKGKLNSQELATAEYACDPSSQAADTGTSPVGQQPV